MLSKFKDIEAVMKKAKKMVPDIEKQYQECLKEEEIPEDLLVDIKDYLANLRTALDYLWHKIPSAPNSHFPVANSKADFNTKTDSIDKKHALALEKFQDYSLGSWIKCFNLFRNKNVHLTLVPQKRRETREFSIKKGGAGMKVRGCTFRGNIAFGVGGVRVPIDEATQFPVDVPGVDITRIIWVDFLFDGSSISPEFPRGVSALSFLKNSLSRVEGIITEIEKQL